VTDSDRELPALMDWARRYLPELIPDAQIAVRRLGQGPPVDAPIEIRLFGRDPAALAEASEAVMSVLRRTPGAIDVRHRLSDGIPTLHYDIDEAEAARYGVTRAAIAQALADATRGNPASSWHAGREPMPILVRTAEGERLPEQALGGLSIASNRGLVPLDLFVRVRTDLQPAVIEHRDLERMTAVLAETAEGQTYSQVLDRAMPGLNSLNLPEGVRWTLGGSAAEADSANSALLRTLPIGGLLLAIILLWQFNSFRLAGMVLATVPLAAVGVIPGLILAGQAFSFTAMLGVVALVGIVVNNAIVL
jgi:multidrug efflux pump subunit AcrB